MATGNPKQPKFGGLATDGKTPWVGGPPKADWSSSLRSEPESPCCYRPDDAVSQMKSYGRRVEGSSTKFKQDDPEYSLTSFGTDALAHMKEYGMDTFFYLEGSSSEAEAKDLFLYHTKYTKATVDAFVKECMGEATTNTCGIGELDHWGKECLKDSGTWLMNSLDETRCTQLCPQLPPRPYGPTVWMVLVREVQMDSLRRVTMLVKKFEATKVSDFKGENVRDYCTSVQTILLQLEREDQLPPTHLLTLVDAFCDVSVQDFRIGWMSRKKDVSNFVRDSAGKDPAIVLKMSNYIHFQSLLAEAKEDYQSNLHRWGAAAGKDAQLSAMQSKLDKVTNQLSKVNQQLDQKPSPGKPNNSGSTDKCAECGGNHPTAKHAEIMKKRAENKIKFAPPKQGEPTTKEINGKLMHYCTKCSKGHGHWGDHLTKDHSNGNDNTKRRHKKKGAGGNLHRLDPAPPASSPPASSPPVPPSATEGVTPPPELAPLSETFTHLTTDLWTS